MDLYCCETTENEIKAYDDPTLLQDRVLKNLLKTEDRYVLPFPASFAVQLEVTPEMRKIVAEWMLEVRYKRLFKTYFQKNYYKTMII